MLKPLDITHIPQKPWVYLFKTSKDEILYIGKAKNLYKRVSQYFTPWSVRKQDMLAQADHIDFIVVENESESLYLESNLIKQHLPPFNNMLKGANAYAYIKLTRHPVPQILITRKRSMMEQPIFDQSIIPKNSKNFSNISGKLSSIEHVLSLSSIKKNFVVTIIFSCARGDVQK